MPPGRSRTRGHPFIHWAPTVHTSARTVGMVTFHALPEWVWMALTLLSIATFFGSLIVLRILIIRMPPDYFAGREPAPNRWADSHPAVRMSALIAKNVLGTILVVFGVVMLFTPGQGILSILMG